MRGMRAYIIVAFILLCFLFVDQADGISPGGQVKVAVTMPALGAIVEEVGGDRVEVVSLLPRDADPHSYEPSLEFILNALSNTSLIVASGPSHLPVEERIQRLVEEGVIDSLVVDYRDYESMGLLLLTIPEIGATNPHGYFYSFSGQKAIAKACAEKLKKIDPANSNYYEERLRKYLQKISMLEDRIRAVGVSGTSVVIGSPITQYLAEDLDLKVVGMMMKAHGIEPTTREILENMDLVKDGKAKLVLMSDVEADENPALVKLLEENNIPYVVVPVNQLAEEPEMIPLVAAFMMKENVVKRGVAGQVSDFITAPSIAANIVLLVLVILLLIRVRKNAG